MTYWIYTLVIATIWTLFIFFILYPIFIRKLRSGRGALYLACGSYFIPLFITWGYIMVSNLMGMGYLILSIIAGIIIVLGSFALHTSVGKLPQKQPKYIEKEKTVQLFERNLSRSVRKTYAKNIF